MSPDQIAAIATALTSLVTQIGVWPIATVILAFGLVVLLVPWIVLIFISWSLFGRLSKAQADFNESLGAIKDIQAKSINEAKQRFEAVREMYEKNAHLVDDYKVVTDALKRLIEDTQGFLVGITASLTEVLASIRTNQFCPGVRVEEKTVKVRQ